MINHKQRFKQRGKRSTNEIAADVTPPSKLYRHAPILISIIFRPNFANSVSFTDCPAPVVNSV